MILGAFNSINHRSVQRRKNRTYDNSSSSRLRDMKAERIYDANGIDETLTHSSGPLGEFDYNDKDFEVALDYHNEPYLKYIGSETDGSKINIPEGITNCSNMFLNCWRLKTPPKIPNGVINCSHMFEGCSSLEEAPEIPEGVEDCSYMFEECCYIKTPPAIPEGVKNCCKMFYRCSLNEVPAIPESVDVSYAMFDGNLRSVVEQGKWNLEHRGETCPVNIREIPDIDYGDSDDLEKE